MGQAGSASETLKGWHRPVSSMMTVMTLLQNMILMQLYTQLSCTKHLYMSDAVFLPMIGDAALLGLFAALHNVRLEIGH